ncbi:hypothetical protein DPMN_104904 [Dreissena polymorpha]|uniref:Uncharacterized protein n=1 Tax=Dreissena polymorpha TaxID=45954 RepID=A0A9D4K1Z8_DREPO|nr:hypothetical protein DPMN_104904 [Dreissena polymorpha]
MVFDNSFILSFTIHSVKASTLNQKVVSLQNREKILLHTQTELKLKIDSYNSIFEDDMEEEQTPVSKQEDKHAKQALSTKKEDDEHKQAKPCKRKLYEDKGNK